MHPASVSFSRSSRTTMCKGNDRKTVRYTHRSSTNTFLRFWKKDHTNYRESAQERWPKMFRLSELPKNILKLEAAMKLKNMIPAVHFHQSVWKVSVEFFTVLFDSKKEKFFKRMRPLKGHEQGCEEIFQAALDLMKKGKNDADSQLQQYLVSSSYTLIGNLMNKESAASWGFSESQHFEKNEKSLKMAREMVCSSLQQACFSSKLIDKVMQVVDPLLHQYSKLRLGEFYVIGIPKSLAEKLAYDAEAFGKPTGYSLIDSSQQFTEHPMVEDGFASENYGNRGGPQMRLLMGKEVLNSEFGVKVIPANNTALVESFCEGLEIVPPEQVPAYQEFFNFKETDFEKEEKERREKLDQELYELVRKIHELSEQIKSIRAKFE